MMKRTVRGSARVAAVVAFAFALAACAGSGDDDKGDDKGSSGGMAAIKVGISPAISAASIFQAMSDGGEFKDAGLHVTAEPVTSGAQAIPLMLNGQLQIIPSDPMTVAAAVAKGVPIQIIAQGSAFGDIPDTDITALVTKNGGPTDLADLEGKKVAVISLNHISIPGIRAAVDAAGGDSSKITFVELPLPNMADAVARGQVAAALTAEPFLTPALQSGLKVLANPLSEEFAGLGQSVYVATKEWAGGHEDEVNAFSKAIQDASDQLADDPDQIRKLSAENTKLTPDQLSQIKLPSFSPTVVDMDKLQSLLDLMLKYGYLDSPLKASELVNPAAISGG